MYFHKTLSDFTPVSDLDWWTMGFHSTNSYLKLGGTLFKPFPNEIKSKLFKNLKGRVAIGKGGKHSNLIPEIGARFAVATLGRTVGKSN